MYQFKYHRPDSIDEALAVYRGAEDGIYLAGGQTLLPTMKMRLAAPTDLIDLSSIKSLTGIEVDSQRVKVGAFTRHADVADHPEIRAALPVLAYVAGQIGDAQVRNRGTLGGSVANSDPAADYPAAIVGLGATVHTQTRSIAADDFFKDLFETALEPGELITGIEFPIPTRAAYQKFPNPASRYAIVGVLVADFGGRIRVGVTGAGPCAFRASELERVLSSDLSPATINGIEVPDAGFNSDLHASQEYRAHLLRVMARRAVAELLG